MTTDKISVLMLGGARRVALAEQLIESGKRLGKDVVIVSYELTRQVPIASVAKVETGLKWNNPDIIADISRVVKKYNIDIILPFVDGAVGIAAKCKQAMPEVFIPVSDESVAEAMFDKCIAELKFKEAGIPIPKTYSECINSEKLIAKPRSGSASKGIKIITSLSEIADVENYLIQEYIERREEFTVDCYISQNGETLCVVPRLRIETAGGEVTQTRTVREQRIINLSKQVLSAMKFRGPITLQFIHDCATDRLLLMEVNPRLGGGVICSIMAGAPITDYILKEALSIPIEPTDDWKDKTLMTRYFKEVIFYET